MKLEEYANTINKKYHKQIMVKASELVKDTMTYEDYFKKYKDEVQACLNIVIDSGFGKFNPATLNDEELFDVVSMTYGALDALPFDKETADTLIDCMCEMTKDRWE